MSTTDGAPVLVERNHQEAVPDSSNDHGVFLPRRLVFTVAGRAYATPAEAVREVMPLDSVTRLPGAPDTIVGLVNVRGGIITVVDAAVVLHRGARRRDLSMMLLVDAGTRGVGLAVEAVADVRSLREDEGYNELDVREVVAQVVAIAEDE